MARVVTSGGICYLQRHRDVTERMGNEFMNGKILAESSLWKQFEDEARKRRRDPVKLVSGYIKECLEIWEDEKLDQEISRQVQRSGYTEDDAVDLVRKYRLEKKSASS